MTQGKLTVPTDEERKLVEAMSGYGVPHEQIANLVCGGIDRDTLAKHFRKELDRGKAIANSKIGKRLFDRAMEGDSTSLIWWTKTQMRWAPEPSKVEVNHSGIDSPIDRTITFNVLPGRKDAD